MRGREQLSRHNDTSVGEAPGHGHRVLSGVYYFHREPKAFSGGCLRVHAIRALAADAPDDDGALQLGALARIALAAAGKVSF